VIISRKYQPLLPIIENQREFCFFRISVRLGAYNLAAPENSSPLQDIEIETIDVHEDYMHDIPENFLEAGQNDIALLRLQSEAVINDNVRPICLPVAQELQNFELLGKNLLLTGWGVTENGNF
jgi:hypothetical protein